MLRILSLPPLLLPNVPSQVQICGFRSDLHILTNSVFSQDSPSLPTEVGTTWTGHLHGILELEPESESWEYANRRAQHHGSHQKEKDSESDKLSDSAVRVSAGDFKPLVPFVAVTSYTSAHPTILWALL